MTSNALPLLSIQGLIRSVEKSVTDRGSAYCWKLNLDKLRSARMAVLAMDASEFRLLANLARSASLEALAMASVHQTEFADLPMLSELRYAERQMETILAETEDGR